MLWAPTVTGVVAFGVLAHVSAFAAVLAAPFAGGLLVAIPLAVLSSGPTAPGAASASGIAAGAGKRYFGVRVDL